MNKENMKRFVLVVVFHENETSSAELEDRVFVCLKVSMGHPRAAWCLPGDHVQHDENPRRTAIRVAEKMLGLAVEDSQLVCYEVNHVESDRNSHSDIERYVFTAAVTSLYGFMPSTNDRLGTVYNQLFSLGDLRKRVWQNHELRGHEVLSLHRNILRRIVDKVFS